MSQLDYFSDQLAKTLPATREQIETMINNRVEWYTQYPDKYPDDFIESQSRYLQTKVGRYLLYYMARQDFPPDEDGKKTGKCEIMSVWDDDVEQELENYEFSDMTVSLLPRFIHPESYVAPIAE